MKGAAVRRPLPWTIALSILVLATAFGTATARSLDLEALAAAPPAELQSTPRAHLVDDLGGLRRVCREVDERDPATASTRAREILRAHIVRGIRYTPPAHPVEAADEPRPAVAREILELAFVTSLEDALTSPHPGEHLRSLRRIASEAGERRYPESVLLVGELGRLAEERHADLMAWQMHECALHLVRAAYGHHSPAAVEALGSAAVAAARLDDRVQAGSSIRRAWSVARKIQSPEIDLRPTVLLHWAELLTIQGNEEAAQRRNLEALDLLESTGRHDTEEAALARERLGLYVPQRRR